MSRVWISSRLSKAQRACITLYTVGWAGMLASTLYMVLGVMLAPEYADMPLWCLIALLAGCVLVVVGGMLEPRARAFRIAAEAIAKARV